MSFIIHQKSNILKYLDYRPKRIVSLVPSQTELLFDLGLNNEVVGITKFCVHPHEWIKNKVKVGGTKTINIEKIQSLHPDLILANKEENIKEQIELLKEICPVYVSDITHLDDAIEMIHQISILVHQEQKGYQLTENILKSFSLLKKNNIKIPSCYFIWKKPYMIAGGNTYISNMMQRCGLSNIFDDKQRYPEITIEDLKMKNCQLVLLSSEPYPFQQKHVDELKQMLGKTIQIMLVDGEMFSWYGSRLLYVPAYFQQLLSQLSIQLTEDI